MIYQRQKNFFREAYRTGEHGWPTTGPTMAVARFLKIIKRGKSQGRLLDIGCGEGRHTIFFAEKGFNAYGIDLEPLAIRHAKRFTKAKRWKRGAPGRQGVHFLIGDVLNLPFSPNSFDIAIDYGCLHHIRKADWKVYFENITRVLKGDAYFILSVFSTKFRHYEGEKRKKKWLIHNNHYDHFFTKGDIRRLFKTTFKVLAIEEKRNGLQTFYHCLMMVKKA